jgi:beta-glucanase (GH16 family)
MKFHRDFLNFPYESNGFPDLFAPGLWPAHWMLPEDGPCWPVGGEIDIMEYLGTDPTAPLQPVHGTLHWSKNKTCNWDLNASQIYPEKTAKAIDFTIEYHVFAVEWRPTNVKNFVDDHVRFALECYLYPLKHI